MAGGPNKAGDIFYDVHANVEPLNTELKQANAKIAAETGGGEVSSATSAYAKRLEKEGTGISATLKRTKKEYGEQIEVVQGLIGKIAAVGGVAYTAFKVGETASEAFIERLKTATERANDFKDSLDLSDVAGSLKKYDEELANLDAQMEQRQSGGWRAWLGQITKSDADIQKEIIAKREERENLARADKARKDTDAKTKAAKESNDKAKDEAKQYAQTRSNVIETMAKEQRAAELAAMDERKRATEESMDKIDAIDKEYMKLSLSDRMKYEDQWNAARNAINQAWFEQKKKWQAEDLKKQQEDAKKVSDAWVSSFRSIREASNSVFNTDQAASMVQFAQQMQVTATMAHANMNRIVVERVG